MLSEGDRVYSAVSEINEAKDDLLIFWLMEDLIVELKEEEEAADGDEAFEIREFRNDCKSILEEIISDKGGYEQPNYEEENDRIRSRKGLIKL